MAICLILLHLVMLCLADITYIQMGGFSGGRRGGQEAFPQLSYSGLLGNDPPGCDPLPRAVAGGNDYWRDLFADSSPAFAPACVLAGLLDDPRPAIARLMISVNQK